MLGHVTANHLSPLEIKTKLGKIRGHLVCLAHDFIVDDQLAAPASLEVNQFTLPLYL